MAKQEHSVISVYCLDDEGNLAGAQQMFQQALAVTQPTGNRSVSAYALFGLIVPGMMHCGNGQRPNQFNPMAAAALERWREASIAPDQIIAMHVANGAVDVTRRTS